MRRTLPLVLIIALAAGSEDAPPGPHGGTWMETPGTDVRYEVVLDKERKRAVAYAALADGTTAAAVKTAPELKLDALDDKAPIPGKALNLKDGVASEFEFEPPPAEKKPSGDPPPNSGPHGGRWLDVGSHTALLEYVHDQDGGRATIWVLEKDGKTPMGLKDAPVFNVDAIEGPVQLAGKAIGLKDGAASQFEFEAPELKTAPPGLASRFVLRIGGKQFNAPMMNREHGHSHGPPK